jgi:hypothetical protein
MYGSGGPREGIREVSKRLNSHLTYEARKMGIKGPAKTEWKIQQVMKMDLPQEQKDYMIKKYQVGHENIRYALQANCARFAESQAAAPVQPVFVAAGGRRPYRSRRY